MKRIMAILLCGLVLGGFGCSEAPIATPDTAADGTSLRPDEKVEGVWHLRFDLPTGWVMVPQYNEDTVRNLWSMAVDNQLTDIVIQSTDKPIALSGSSSLPEGSYVTSDYTYIRVFRMTKSSLVPEEAEDIGERFFKLDKAVNVTYYFVGEYATYKFVVYQDAQDISDAERVILSAEEVTDFTTE